MLSHNPILRSPWLVVVVILPVSVQAGINQVNESNNTSQTYYTPSATDLINQGQPTFVSQTVSGFTPYTGTGTTSTDALNDGLAGSANINSGTAFDLDGTWTSVFNLNTTSNPWGYDINSVQSIAGWMDTRSNQSYTLSYAPVNAPTTYLSLGTYSYSPGSLGANGSSRMTLSNSSGPLARNVSSLKFNFLNAGTVYREVDVFGTASSIAPVPVQLPVRIMPLGDSITRGSTLIGDVPGGYRTRLQQNLISAGKQFDMVGSSSENAPPGGLDPDHNGYNGYRVDQLRANIDTWLSTSNPDVVLLHIGTNDIAQNYQISTLASRLDDLVGEIVTQDTHAQLFVASIIPITQDFNGLTVAQYTNMVNAYNAQIPGIVNKYSALGDNVHFVNMHDLITLNDPNNSANNFFQPGDGIHPGQAGYNQMGDIWYNAIQSVPEPGSITLLTAAAGLLGLRRRVIR